MASPLINKSCYWEPISSSIDWCEKNCQYSRYIAEFFNSFSNLGIMIPPLFGLYTCARAHLEIRFWLMFISQIIVGMGSFLFHATLTHWGQLLDEGPMLIEGLLFFYAVLECEVNIKYPWLPLGLVFYAGIMYILILLKLSPIVFQSTYLALLLTIAYRGGRLMYLSKHQEEKYLMRTSVKIWIFAFMAWVIDYNLCWLLDLMPLRPLFQLHAWWHILTGIGAYYCAQFFVHNRLVILHRHPCIVYLFAFLPYIHVPLSLPPQPPSAISSSQDHGSSCEKERRKLICQIT